MKQFTEYLIQIQVKQIVFIQNKYIYIDMKYRYKISYGGTSSTTTSSNDLNAVNELNNLFDKLIKNKANYYDSSELKKDIDKLKKYELTLDDDLKELGDNLKETYNLDILEIDFSIEDENDLKIYYFEN